MTRPQDVGDNKNYYADDDVGFDSEGYVLAPGDDDGDRQVQKAGAEDAFVGVTHKSTYNHDKTEVLTGQPIAVLQEGEVNVLCEAGTDYTFGDIVYSAGDGLGNADPDPAGDGSVTPTEVGKVLEDEDLTGEDSPGLVKVNITGRV